MIALEPRTSQVALFGRVADELTREDLSPRRVQASLRNHHRKAVQKQDGFFVFADLTPSPPAYDIELAGREFQTRTLTASWPGPTAVAVEPPGEDELHIIIAAITGNRVSFAPVAFLPRIAAGSSVIGEGSTTTLAQDLEGVNAQDADLQAIGALAVDQMVRFARSTRLVMRPGPYYPFPAGTTLAAFRVVENTTGTPPLESAQIEITTVNTAAVNAVLVGGVTLFRATLPGTPAIPFVIGPAAARVTLTNSRGDAVFYYPQATPVSSLTVTVSKNGYVSQVRTVAVVPGQRTFDLVALDRS